jgi:ribosome-associated translation inhibitor RaiA
MKIEFKIRSLNRVAGLCSFVEQELGDLQSEIHIESAQVVLEKEPERVPACRASVLLVVPGLDIRAAASDHTMLAAWLKTRTELKRQIKWRKARQAARLKSNLQIRGPSCRRA